MKPREGDILTIRLSAISPTPGNLFRGFDPEKQESAHTPFDAEILSIQRGSFCTGDPVILAVDRDPRKWEIKALIGDQAWVEMVDPNYPDIKDRVVEVKHLGHWSEVK
jgi:hypothetical protein